jgi:hypothetical protein
MELNDPFGRMLDIKQEFGIDPNKSGTWNLNICRSDFTNGLGPYIVKLIVKDYYSTQRQSTKEIMFLEIPNSSSGGSSGGGTGASPTPTVTVTAKPAPAPTVTVTASPAPAPTVTVTVTAKPAPAPTVTVTASPAPAPTVTVTASPAPAPTVTVTTTAAPVVDPYFKNEALRLQGELNAMRTEFDALKVKVAKICKVKPKPKYC